MDKSTKWVIEAMIQGKSFNPINNKKSHSYDRSGAKLKFCTVCKKVWEHVLRGQNYYKVIPTYKLPRVTCLKCRKKDK